MVALRWRRRQRTFVERLVLAPDVVEVDSARALAPYVSALPSGLHLLDAPEHTEVMAGMAPNHRLDRPARNLTACYA